MPRKKFAWALLPDEQLLQPRFRDLDVTVEGTWLEDCLSDLHDELDQRGIRVRPHAWISNEWFSSDSTPGIAIKRIFRTLELDGYARIDFRLSADGIPYFLEANPNPEIASTQEFAHAAVHNGIAYPDLLNRILALGIRRASAAD